MARRSRKTEEPGFDPEMPIDIGDVLTATMWPVRTKYRKRVEITGRVREVGESCITVMCADGFHTIRRCDILRVRKVVTE